MTVDEFSNEFDIALSKFDIQIDEYEKSVFLTRAQLGLVTEYFFTSFEKNSKVRNDLRELIKSYTSTDKIISTNGISTDSKFFKIPTNVYFIIQEQCILESLDETINNKVVDVAPKTHDEYNIQIKNPFKTPDLSIVWRLDFYKQNCLDSNIELISPYDIGTYKVRYVSYPEPIVLTNLSTRVSGEGLSIEGVTTSQTCKLSESIHREILTKAVELFLLEFKQKS